MCNKAVLVAIILGALCLADGVQSAMADAVPSANPVQPRMLKVDHRALVSRADIVYDKLVPRPEEGLPIGNGSMGGLVWVTGRDIQMQINRPDVFGNNSYTALSAHGELGFGCGKLTVDLGEGAFPQVGTRQHLSLYDALAKYESPGLVIQNLAWSNDDVMAFRIEDQRAIPAPGVVRLQMLRAPELIRGKNRAISKLGEVQGRIVLTQVYEEPAANGIIEGDHYCSSALVAGLAGRDGSVRIVDEKTIELITPAGKGVSTVFVATAATMDRKTDVVAVANAKLKKAADLGFNALTEQNQTWWHELWSKSFLNLHSDDGNAQFLEKYRTGWLYNMAASSRGKYPPEWGNQLWYSRGDRHNWSGGRYWWWNLMCNYRGLAAADHLELATPVYDLYSGAFANAALHAKQVRGCEGIFLSETMTWNGPEKLPEAIGNELRDFLIAKKTFAQTSPEFKAYARQRNANESSWCWIELIQGDEASPYSWHAHTFSSGAKIAWQFYRAYEYTVSEKWLRERAYPMVKGMAEFYRTYPDVKKDEEGKYHIHHVNSHEPLWGANDTHEELSAMRAMFNLAIHCSEILKVDAGLRPKWKEVLDNLAPLPTSDTPNAVGVIRHPSGQPAWANGVGPLRAGSHDDLTSPTWTRPCVDYDLWTPETNDSALTEIALRTLEATPWYQDMKNGKSIFCISEVPPTVVMMGRAEEVKTFLPNQLRAQGQEIQLMPNYLYFQDFDPAHAYLTSEGVGYSADNLQNALLQSVAAGPGQDPVIRVFPAWPKEWDASFQLAARRGFLVTSSIGKGEVEFIESTSRLGGVCRLRNPWLVKGADVYRNGSKAEQLTGEVFAIPTTQGENIVLVPTGNSPKRLARKVP